MFGRAFHQGCFVSATDEIDHDEEKCEGIQAKTEDVGWIDGGWTRLDLMNGSPPPDGHVHDGNVDRPEDSHGRAPLCAALTIIDERAECEVAGKNQEQY